MPAYIGDSCFASLKLILRVLVHFPMTRRAASGVNHDHVPVGSLASIKLATCVSANNKNVKPL
jgi:hypothetical protein